MLACLLEAAGTGFGRVFGLPNGFAGAPRCETVELSDLMAADAGEMRAGLARTPGAWLGLSSGRPEPADFARVLALMRARDSHHLVGMGGGGTMAALAAFHAFAAASDWPLAVAGAPNTIKNDIESVEFSPGFASAARFLALAVRDIDRDLRAMAGGERVVLVEVSGGATGWLAATAVAFRADYDDPPHLVLTPERGIDREALASHIARQRDLFGRALVVANEQEDSVTGLPRRRISLGPLLRAHSARLSPADLDLARDAAHAAARAVLASKAVMAAPGGDRPLDEIAGIERPLPAEFLSRRPPHVADGYRDLVRSIVGGHAPVFRPPFQ